MIFSEGLLNANIHDIQNKIESFTFDSSKEYFIFATNHPDVPKLIAIEYLGVLGAFNTDLDLANIALNITNKKLLHCIDKEIDHTKMVFIWLCEHTPRNS